MSNLIVGASDQSDLKEQLGSDDMLVSGADLALGGVAFGGFTVGGVAIGGFAVGSIAIGLTAYGASPHSLWTLTEAAFLRINLFGWLIQTAPPQG